MEFVHLITLPKGSMYIQDVFSTTYLQILTKEPAATYISLFLMSSYTAKLTLMSASLGTSHGSSTIVYTCVESPPVGGARSQFDVTENT
jgi:hypothetical protein